MEHTHEHTHTHVHDGVEHAHTHSHPHSHDHSEGHEHTHGSHAEGEETTALLRYMLDHNVHHCAELKDLSEKLTGEAQHQLLHAIEDFQASNGHLAKVLELLGA